jgi:hypothetical protein
MMQSLTNTDTSSLFRLLGNVLNKYCFNRPAYATKKPAANMTPPPSGSKVRATSKAATATKPHKAAIRNVSFMYRLFTPACPVCRSDYCLQRQTAKETNSYFPWLPKSSPQNGSQEPLPKWDFLHPRHAVQGRQREASVD